MLAEVKLAMTRSKIGFLCRW